MLLKIPTIILLIASISFSQNKIEIDNLKSSFATLERQEIEYSKAKDKVQQLLNADSVLQLREGLNLAQLYFIRDEIVENTLRNILANHSDSKKRLLMTALETSKILYPDTFNELYKEIIDSTKDSKIFAIALNSLSDINEQFYLEILFSKFPFDDENPILKCLEYQLAVNDSTKFSERPPLEDLLNHDFQDDKTIIFTFFRNDRIYPGLSIIKKPDGSFVTDENGEIFSIPQLGLSYADFPGYITNGNTPEGIFSIVGTYISPTESIGPTRNILTRIAYEVSPEIFFHTENEYTFWNIEDYIELLPESWEDYFPIYEAFYAGQAGRKVIIMHGSADDLRFFENNPYYPHTPTKGCISSIELWNPENGKCSRSDQADLINAFYSTGQTKGFLVIVELDDKHEPVSLSDIQNYIN